VSVHHGLRIGCVENVPCLCLATGDQTAAAAPKQKREKKEAFKINFYEPLGMSAKEFAKEKFAPPTRGVGINLPGYSLPKPGKKGSKKNKEKEKEKEKREEQVLPDDMHFTSRQLVTLFLKPDFSVQCMFIAASRD